MCGRFVQFAAGEVYAEAFDLLRYCEAPPRYNLAPTQAVLVIRADTEGARELVPLHWGLVPSWSKGPDSRFSMINARAETVHTKPAYRAAFKYRRCLIPSEGFYEWKAESGGKQPYLIQAQDQKPFAMAGLWEHWQDPNGNELESCSIIVTEANASIRPIHDRMPAIIAPEHYREWLDPKLQTPDELRALLVPDQTYRWRIQPVSKRVNGPRNDDATLIEPLPEAEE
jgi:putative SOS response-associated peptidase YedK